MWIESIRVEGGILDGFEQSFDPQLNVIVGGRGTGKSSVVELIRFCLGSTSYTDSGQQEAIEHALGVLGDGRVTVTITDDKQRFELSRTAQDLEPEADNAILPPFVFSQSEIESIGLQAQSRLRLIDGFWRSRRPPRGSSESALASRIRSATAEIRSLLSEIDDIAEKTAELPRLEAQLAQVKLQGTPQLKVNKEIQASRLALEELTPQLAAARVRSELMARVSDRLHGWLASFNELLTRKPKIEPWPSQAGGIDELAEIRKKEAQAVSGLDAEYQELRNAAKELEQKRAASASQAAGFENRARELRQKIEEHQKGASVVDKKISDLTQQITVLRSLIDLRKQREARANELVLERRSLLKELEVTRQWRTDKRSQVAQSLSKELGPAIRINVLGYSQYGEYISAVAAALRGSGLRYNDLSERIAETFSPPEIAELAEQRNIEVVAAQLNVSEERALRICDALRSEDSSTLLTASIEDDIDIELLDGTDYKGIGFLSTGQRCTTILPVILRHNERIVVLDQPEDHLDNAFIVGTLVKSIISRSRSAQSIIATHNANIPVLGGAAQVIHMDSDGSRCFARAVGPVDSMRIVEAITTIMEGGREAFMKRADFYSKHMPNVSKR